MQGAAYKWSNGEGIGKATVTLNKLIAGHQYQVQVWVNDSRAGGVSTRTQAITGANTCTTAFNSTQVQDGVGQYVIGSFTAIGKTQSFVMDGGNNTPQINTIQLRDISGTGNITWGMPKTISGEVDLSTTGMLLYAYSNSGSNTNVNGVNFAGVDSSTAWGTDVTLSGFNASVTTAFAGGSTAPWSSLSTGYQTILKGGAYHAGSGAGSVTLNNLVAGRRYQVQFWVNDSRAGGTTTRAETLTGNNIGAMAFNSTQAQDGVGQFAVGTFTAAGTTQSFTINGGTNLPKINAIQVREITSVFVASLPVTSGLVLRLDASQVTCADGDQLNTWTDTSGAFNHAVRQSGSPTGSPTGYPKYIARGTNGLPVVRFDSSTNIGDWFKFPRISNIKTVFWVIKEKVGLNDEHFLLGDDAAYQFHRGSANGAIWSSTYADANIKNGITKLMGNVIDGTTESLPSESYQLVSLVTTGDVQANQICQDRNVQDRNAHGSWQGDIAEILIYNRALTGFEEGAIGSYLATKYALHTAYSGSKAPAVPTGVLATSTSPGAIRVSWPAVSSAISYNIWCKPSAGGMERVITGVTASPYIVTGLAAGISYDFKVATINAIGTSAYSSVSTATALRSSEKDIRLSWSAQYHHF